MLRRWVADEERRPDEPGAPPTTAAAIDLGRISELRSLRQRGGPDILAALVRAFVDEAPAQLAALEAAVAADDAFALRLAAHAMKGCSANLGAPRLAALCAELESAGHSVDLTVAVQTLSLLRTELDRVQTALHADLRQAAPRRPLAHDRRRSV